MRITEQECDVLEALIARARAAPVSVIPTVQLSARELAVLQLRADGLTTRAIAGRLGVAPDTVKNQLVSAYDKLGQQCAAGAVAEGFRRGLLK